MGSRASRVAGPCRFLWKRGFAAGILLAGTIGFLPAARAVVVTEIHYNPPPGEEDLEFVELTNDLATPEDLSGYVFTAGIDFEFPQGTILGPHAILVVCLNVQAVQARWGIENALGNFAGRLDAGGDRVTLANHAGVVVQSLRYRDRGKWPSGPDGTGHTLSLRHLYLDPSEPESWTQSAELGGTPGRANFPEGESNYEDRDLIPRGATWSYAKGTQEFSTPPTAWRDPSFDDASWLTGPSGFGYGDGDDATLLEDMPNLYTSVALRKRFVLEAGDLAAGGEPQLECDYDDGFIAWLNGTEIARSNCGAVGEEFPASNVATGSREAGSMDLYPVPRNLLVEGENVLTVAGFNFSIGSSDLSLIPRFFLRRTTGATGTGLPSVVFNELRRTDTAGEAWVELVNLDFVSADLGQYRITDLPGRPDPFLIPSGTRLSPGAFLAIDEAGSGLDLSRSEVHLFLLAPDGRVAAAAVFDRAKPTVYGSGEWSELRLPDGGELEWTSDTPTRGAANEVSRVSDVVINEIFYHPPEERPGEFLELHNRGTSAVDLSGFRFDKGIDYEFPSGTSIPAAGWIVVAEDPALLLAHHGLAGALGPYAGRLANEGENVRLVDGAGNPVDEVRYAEGGAWSRWADGGGASLELADPRADNSFGAAWEASDESEKASWEELSFPVEAYVPAGSSELHLFLVERGVCRIDDVSIRRGAGANLIPNPGFEADTSPWIIQGTHIGSRRIATDAHSGAASLEINASGKGDTLVNRIEVDTSPAMTAGAYVVSLWARWISGGSLLVAHGEYTAGAYGGRPAPATNLSGNSLSKGLRLTIPWDLGTPGAENTARIRLLAGPGAGNLGPTLADPTNDPPSPGAGQPTRILVRAVDPDGIASIVANWREGSALGSFASIVLHDDGGHGDGFPSDGLYAGEIPPQAQGARIVFYLEAEDSLGARTRHPLDAPARTCLYQVQGSVGSGVDSGLIVMDEPRTVELQSRTLHSNELLDGSFVFNQEKIYYSVGIRYRGSPWGRPGRSNYRVRMEEDEPFIRNRQAINIDPSGGGPNEGAACYLQTRNSGPGSAAPAMEYAYLRTWFNGSSLGMRGLLQAVDRDFFEDWYGDADALIAYKVEGRRMFDDAANLVGWDGGSFIHRGDDKEHYRGYFIPVIRRSVDDWTSFVALTRAMDTRTTSNTAFDAEIGKHLDVESFLRVLAPRILMADWDAFCIGNGHNGFTVLDPRDGRWEVLPWDMDNTFGDPNAALFPTGEPYVARLLGRSVFRRLYYRILWEYCQRSWSSAVSGPWLDALAAGTGIGTAGIRSYIDTSSARVQGIVRSSTTQVFRIVTNTGADIVTDDTDIELVGEAPIQIAAIYVSRNRGEPVPLDAAWPTLVRWQETFALPEADNLFEFLGFDGDGNLVASDSIAVHSSAHDPVVIVDSIEPARGPLAGGTRVAIAGSGFAPEIQVLFGGKPAAEVLFVSAERIEAVTPPLDFPAPSGGVVDVELALPPSGRRVIPGAYTYVLEGGFVRGDATNDGTVDISDGVAILFYLFRSSPVLCLDAADATDDGRITITDAVSVLDFLFRNGAPPASPYPAPGTDSTADSLGCPQ